MLLRAPRGRRGRLRSRIRHRGRGRDDVLRRGLTGGGVGSTLQVALNIPRRSVLKPDAAGSVRSRIELKQRQIDQLGIENLRIDANVEERTIDRESLSVVADCPFPPTSSFLDEAELKMS